QTLAGPVPVGAALRIAPQALRRGPDADEGMLVAAGAAGGGRRRGYSSARVDLRTGDWREGAGHPAGPGNRDGELAVPEAALAAVGAVLDRADPDGVAVTGQA